MAVSVINIGRYVTSPDPDVAALTGGTMLACCYAATSQHLWGYRFRGRIGRSGGTTPTVRLALYAKSGSNPSDLLGYSGTISASTLMTSSAGGAFEESNVALSTDGPSNASIPIPSGTIPALAILATGASLNAGMLADNGSFADANFYRRTGLSQPPPDPFGTPSISPEGNLSVSLYCHTNEAPVSCNNRSPSGFINSTAPTLEADHRDRNGAWGPGNSGFNDGDYLRQYQVQVRRKSDGVSFWAPAAFTADSSERASNHFNVAYGGTALVRGTEYEWRCRTSDHFGAWYAWGDSDWLSFTPASLSFVTLAGAPTGKIETNQPTFDLSWNHQSALSTNAVRMQLYQGDTLVYTSGIITKSIANNASGTISWADSGLGTPYPSGLNWGQTWRYRIQGRDTGGAWSDYSDLRTFNTDAAPSIPDGLEPSNAQTVTSRPTLFCYASDVDDTSGTGLVTYAVLAGPVAASNQDFEGGSVSPWVSPSVTNITKTFTQDAVVFHGGAKSGKIAVTVNTNVGVAQVNVDNGDLVPVVAGSSVTVKPWVRTSILTMHPRAQIHWHDVAGAYLSSSIEADYTPGAINTWAQRSLTATAPASAAQMKQSVAITIAAGVVGNVWIDDVAFDPTTLIKATMTPVGDHWEYTPTADEMTAFGTYTWYAYAFDGTLYSGAKTVEANATHSAVETFVYANGPTATITSPANLAVVTSSTPTVTWTSSSQNRYRLRIYAADGVTLVYERGWVISAALSWAVPAGFIHDATTYVIELGVEDNQPLQGFAARVTVTTAFTKPAAATGVTSAPVKIDAFDPWETGIQVGWDASAEPGGTFVGWYLYRDDLGFDGAPYVILDSPTDTSFIDPVPASGRQYTYALRAVVQRDLDQVSSAAVFTSATVVLRGVVICDVNNPLTNRIVLDSTQSRDQQRQRPDQKDYNVGSDHEPITFDSPVAFWKVPGEYRIGPDPIATDQRTSIVDRMARVRAFEALNPMACYRDERGEVLFGKVSEFSFTQHKLYPDVRFTFSQKKYTLGVVLE